MALSHLGVGVQLGNAVTETSTEAKACREFFEPALISTLKDYKWPWAKKFTELALVEEEPGNGFNYSYRYPSDCIDVRAVEASFDLTPGVIFQKPSPYDLGFDSSGLLIYSDIDDASIMYTPKITNFDVYPENFKIALSYRLASYIAPRLTKGDPFKLGNKAFQMYQIEIARASASSFNETKPAENPDSDMISIRNT